MKALLAACLAVAVLVAGCAQPQSQQVDKDQLAKIHLEAKCPVQVSAAGGLSMTVKECVFEVEDGKLETTSITCTGLKKSANSPKLNREGTLAVTFYTPADKQATKSFKMSTEAGDSHIASCTIKGAVDTYGKYTVVFMGGCLKDSHPFVPGLQSTNARCTAKDSGSLTRWGKLA